MAWALPATTVGAPGVPGGPTMTEPVAVDAAEVPPPLVAVLLKV